MIEKRQQEVDDESQGRVKHRNVADIVQMESPSQAARASTYCDRINSAADPKILNLRPPTAVGPPLTLYHPIFSRFLEILSAAHYHCPPEILPIAIRLCRLAGVHFENGRERLDAMQPLLAEALGHESKMVTITGADAGSFLSVVCDGVPAVVWEYRDRIGDGTNDAYIQGSLTWAKLWAEPVRRRPRAFSIPTSHWIAFRP